MNNNKSNNLFNPSLATLSEEFLTLVSGGNGNSKPNNPTFSPTSNWASDSYYSLASMFPSWNLPLGSIDWSAVSSAAALQGNSSMIAGAAVGAVAGSFAGGVGALPGALGGAATGAAEGLLQGAASSIIKQMH